MPRRHWTSAAAVLLLAACSVGPWYHHPDVAPPPEWSTKASPDAPEWPAADWWRGFKSPDLDSLIAQAQAANAAPAGIPSGRCRSGTCAWTCCPGG